MNYEPVDDIELDVTLDNCSVPGPIMQVVDSAGRADSLSLGGTIP
jgi:hypothetical protein